MAGAQERLIVDLSRVSFIASAGLRTLIAGARGLIARQGRMVCLDPDPLVEQVLLRSGVDRLIPVCRELSEAIQAVCVGGGAGRGDPEDEPLAFHLEADRTMAGVRRVGAWVDELAILLNLSGESEYALRLCLEEAVTNIVHHAIPASGEPGTTPGAPHGAPLGAPHGAPHGAPLGAPPGAPLGGTIGQDRVTLRLLATAGRLVVRIEDRCGSFNPLATPLPAPDEPAPEGEGGLGIRAAAPPRR